MKEEEIRCPRCDSNRVVKSGYRYGVHGKRQRYLCKGCGHVFCLDKVRADA